MNTLTQLFAQPFESLNACKWVWVWCMHRKSDWVGTRQQNVQKKGEWCMMTCLLEWFHFSLSDAQGCFSYFFKGKSIIKIFFNRDSTNCIKARLFWCETSERDKWQFSLWFLGLMKVASKYLKIIIERKKKKYEGQKYHEHSKSYSWRSPQTN